MLLPMNAAMMKGRTLNLNRPAVTVTSLKGSGVNAPNNTINSPCSVNWLETVSNFSLDKNGSLLLFNKMLTASPINQPNPQPINPPTTEKNAVQIAICCHLFGAAKTQVASKGSVGKGSIMDSSDEYK